MEEEMTVLEMQRFLNQQYAEGKTELEAYRNLMMILGLSYPKKEPLNKATLQTKNRRYLPPPVPKHTLS